MCRFLAYRKFQIVTTSFLSSITQSAGIFVSYKSKVLMKQCLGTRVNLMQNINIRILKGGQELV